MSQTSFELSAFPPEEAPKASRICSSTGRPFQLGDKMYSVLYEESGNIKRLDLCAKAWRELSPITNAIAWWSTRVGATEEKKTKSTPNDALVTLFESLVFKPDQADLRYALALLLVRRRVFRFEFERNVQSEVKDMETQQDVVFVYNSRNDACYMVPVVPMDPTHIADVQKRLVAVLDEPTSNLLSEEAPISLMADDLTDTLNQDDEPTPTPKESDNC